jgi:hypothetical protein
MSFYTPDSLSAQTRRLLISGTTDVADVVVYASNLKVGGGDFIMYSNKFLSVETGRLTASGALTAASLAATGAVTGSNLNVSNWDTAYGWGDHASGGYAPTAAPTFTGGITTTGRRRSESA